MREQQLTLFCDVKDCAVRLSLVGATVTWRDLYELARDRGWAIREDSLNLGGQRRRIEHQHFCPAHRIVRSRPGGRQPPRVGPTGGRRGRPRAASNRE